MFVTIITSLLDIVLQLFKIPIIALVSFIVIYILLIYLNIFVRILKGSKLPKGKAKIKKHNFLRLLFWDAPKQYVTDLFNRPDYYFTYQGLIIYTGRQGSGKTATVARDALLMKKEYPKAKLISNIAFKNQDSALTHWKQLVKYKNGPRGVIVIMDELQNWFNSNQSRNFPPEMLGVVTQNRKNRRVILGTAQSFHLLAKTIRSQCVEVRSCTTLLGCITIVLRREPILNSEGDVEKWKNKGMYFHVHNQELREAYNTWEVVENLSAAGFKDTPLETNIVNNLIVPKK